MAADDINELMQRAQAEAARAAAIRLARQVPGDRTEAEPEVPPVAQEPVAPTGTGLLTVEKRQGRWRCFLAGERIRSGDPLEVYVNAQVGWVRGRLIWGRTPHTPPAVRIDAQHPSSADALGEFELQLPEDAVCRWPDAS